MSLYLVNITSKKMFVTFSVRGKKKKHGSLSCFSVKKGQTQTLGVATSSSCSCTVGIASHQKDLQNDRVKLTSLSKASDVIKTGLNHSSCQKKEVVTCKCTHPHT
jgi:hypothetical protein